jgi:hypothetical protein
LYRPSFPLVDNTYAIFLIDDFEASLKNTRKASANKQNKKTTTNYNLLEPNLAYKLFMSSVFSVKIFSVSAMSSQFVYFGFDRVSGHTVFDDSGSGNNGLLSSLATVTKTSGTCGNGLRLQGGMFNSVLFESNIDSCFGDVFTV